MLANLLGAVVTLAVGISLIGPISKEVTNAMNQSEVPVTGVSATIFDNIGLFMAIPIILAGFAMVYNGLRQAGLFGGDSDYHGDDDEKTVSHLRGKYVEKHLRKKLIDCDRCNWEKIYGYTSTNGIHICEDCALEIKLLGEDDKKEDEDDDDGFDY